MLIEVIEADIANGIRGDCEHCPIACALKRTLGINTLKVLSRYIRINGDVYGNNDEMRDFIRKFDGGEKVEPFSFELSREESC